ncbi:MAG: DUF3783 domain-containing protein [Thermodesulfobacteriota bacterium]
MTDATFEKITLSDKPLYGPEKLIVCGFSAELQPKFEVVLDMAGLKKISLVWALENQRDAHLSELTDLPSGSGRGESSALPRAIIVAGITERQLQTLMAVCRQSGMKKALWATLTPTSETWLLKDLLAELSAEREALQPQ